MGARGHEVHLAIEHDNQHWTRDQTHDMIDRLCARHARITRGMAPGRGDVWRTLVYGVREGIDYLRYLDPRYANAVALRARAASEAPALVVSATRWPLLRTRRGIALLDRLLRWLERAVPDSATVSEFLRARDPDLLLLTPLVAEPSQADYIGSARSLGLRSALCVASWDNLTNKGMIHQPPDRVYVWNGEQRREAVELHGVGAERVVVTGAQCFDHWFAWRSSSSAEHFRAERACPPDQAILCSTSARRRSSLPTSPRSSRAGCERCADMPTRDSRRRPYWSARIPRAGPSGVRALYWALPGVAVWPPAGTMHIDEQAHSDFFDSIHHSGAVVGINTSALIESAILGRRVFTLLDPQFKHAQEGTLHFQYLLRANGGPLTVAESFDGHFDQLSAALADGGQTGEIERRFVARFIRPHGLERPALPRLVDALEEQISAPAPLPAPADADAARRAAALRPLAHAAGWWDRHFGKRGLRRTVALGARRRRRRLYRLLRPLPGRVALTLIGLLKRKRRRRRRCAAAVPAARRSARGRAGRRAPARRRWPPAPPG